MATMPPPHPPWGGGGGAAGKGVGSRPHTQSAQPPRGGGTHTHDTMTTMTPQTSHPLTDTGPQRGPMWGADTPLPAPLPLGCKPWASHPCLLGRGATDTLLPLRDP